MLCGGRKSRPDIISVFLYIFSGLSGTIHLVLRTEYRLGRERCFIISHEQTLQNFYFFFVWLLSAFARMFIKEEEIFLGNTDGTTNTLIPLTNTATTDQPLTKRCKEDHRYLYLHNFEAEMCVHIVNGDNFHWGKAKSNCEKEGSKLVVLDSHSKALLLRNFLAHNTRMYIPYQ